MAFSLQLFSASQASQASSPTTETSTTQATLFSRATPLPEQLFNLFGEPTLPKRNEKTSWTRKRTRTSKNYAFSILPVIKKSTSTQGSSISINQWLRGLSVDGTALVSTPVSTGSNNCDQRRSVTLQTRWRTHRPLSLCQSSTFSKLTWSSPRQELSALANNSWLTTKLTSGCSLKLRFSCSSSTFHGSETFLAPGCLPSLTSWSQAWCGSPSLSYLTKSERSTCAEASARILRPVLPFMTDGSPATPFGENTTFH